MNKINPYLFLGTSLQIVRLPKLWEHSCEQKQV